MTARRRTTVRESRGGTHSWLLKLVARLKSDAPLSLADRQAAALLLSQIANDDDVRERFFTTVNHRPRNHDPRAWDAAWIYLFRVKFKGEKSGKKLRGDIAELSGMTDAQVDHAVRDHRHTIQLALEAFGPEMSAAKATECHVSLRLRGK